MADLLQGLTGTAGAFGAQQRGRAGSLATLLQFMQTQQMAGEKTRQFDVETDIARQKAVNVEEQNRLENILDLIGQFEEQSEVQRSLLEGISGELGIGQLPGEEAFEPEKKPKAGKVIDTDQGLFLLIDNELQPLQFEGERLTKTPKTTKKTAGQLTPAKESDILSKLLKDDITGRINLADTTEAQQALDFIRRSVEPEGGQGKPAGKVPTLRELADSLKASQAAGSEILWDKVKQKYPAVDIPKLKKMVGE